MLLTIQDLYPNYMSSFQTVAVVSSLNNAPTQTASPSLLDQHISLLQQQLATTSSVANQLVSHQHGLISTVCRQLESLQLEDRVQDHFTRLHHYQAELEQYYNELQTAFYKVLITLQYFVDRHV